MQLLTATTCLDHTVTMLKTIVVLFVLSAIGCTTYGAPANVSDDHVLGLVNSRNLHSLDPSMTLCY